MCVGFHVSPLAITRFLKTRFTCVGVGGSVKAMRPAKVIGECSLPFFRMETAHDIMISMTFFFSFFFSFSQASGLRVILLRWSALFVVERDAWLSRYGETTVASMALIFGHEDVIRRLSIFCRSVKVSLIACQPILFLCVRSIITFYLYVDLWWRLHQKLFQLILTSVRVADYPEE